MHSMLILSINRSEKRGYLSFRACRQFCHKNGERSRKASFHAATAALHSKHGGFSSLSRRNAMKAEHLHLFGAALLACPPHNLRRRRMKSAFFGMPRKFAPFEKTELRMYIRAALELADKERASYEDHPYRHHRLRPYLEAACPPFQEDRRK